jgi:hypothetical protein
MITVKLSGGTWNEVPVIAAKDENGEVKALINVFIPKEETKIRLAVRVNDDIYDMEANPEANIQDTFEELLNRVNLTLKESCEGCTCGGNCNERTKDTGISEGTK